MEVHIKYELEFLAPEERAQALLSNVHEMAGLIGHIKDEHVWIAREPDSPIPKSKVTFFTFSENKAEDDRILSLVS